MIGERDILGTQLIRRNDELALLYEKIKIQQSTLNKGQLQYRDRWGLWLVPSASLSPSCPMLTQHQTGHCPVLWVQQLSYLWTLLPACCM